VTRVFRRGELKQAIVELLADEGPAHGYAVLAGLRRQVGPHWRPSPGAVYPALLALEDAGLITGARDGDLRTYAVTDRGRHLVDPGGRVVARAAARLGTRRPAPTVGDLLDDFASTFPDRRHVLVPTDERAVVDVLDRAQRELATLTTPPDPDPGDDLDG
jgi:DNA-binding transcriptional ArsR family regulator